MLLVEAWLQSSQVPTAQYRPILQWCWGEWSIRDKAGVRAEAVTAKGRCTSGRGPSPQAPPLGSLQSQSLGSRLVQSWWKQCFSTAVVEKVRLSGVCPTFIAFNFHNSSVNVKPSYSVWISLCLLVQIHTQKTLHWNGTQYLKLDIISSYSFDPLVSFWVPVQLTLLGSLWIELLNCTEWSKYRSEEPFKLEYLLFKFAVAVLVSKACYIQRSWGKLTAITQSLYAWFLFPPLFSNFPLPD